MGISIKQNVLKKYHLQGQLFTIAALLDAAQSFIRTTTVKVALLHFMHKRGVKG